MAAGTYNITIDQGSDFTLNFTVKEDGSAKNLSSYSVRAALRKKREDSSPAVQFTGTVDNSVIGKATITLTNAQTKNLTAGFYFYDIEIFTASDAEVIRVVQGTANVTREITR